MKGKGWLLDYIGVNITGGCVSADLKSGSGLNQGQWRQRVLTLRFMFKPGHRFCGSCGAKLS